MRSELTTYSDGSATMINIAIRDSGAIQRVEPSMNAVIVQLIEAPQEDGTMKYRRVVSVMCKDEGMLDILKDEARHLMARF